MFMYRERAREREREREGDIDAPNAMIHKQTEGRWDRWIDIYRDR